MAKTNRFFGPHQNAGAQATGLNEFFHEFYLVDRSRVGQCTLNRQLNAPMGKLMPIFKTFFRLSLIEYLLWQSYLIPDGILELFRMLLQLGEKAVAYHMRCELHPRIIWEWVDISPYWYPAQFCQAFLHRL